MYLKLTLNFRVGNYNLFIAFFNNKRNICDFFRLYQDGLNFYKVPTAVGSRKLPDHIILQTLQG